MSATWWRDVRVLCPALRREFWKYSSARRFRLKGARAVVIGRSDIVGKPVAMLLLHEHATVTICHSRTRDLPAVAREADILVAAMGKPAFVTGDFIKPGSTVIDVGINRLTTEEEVRKIFHDPTGPLATLQKRGSVLVGDVQPEDARAIAGAFTPVPGGVGPLTIVMLMSNTIQAARLRRGIRAVVSGKWLVASHRPPGGSYNSLTTSH